mmetsp:Transcript_13790/g.33686  ORF Transcript_13790/g.33686 Transcript_13790/m.33686 type:complete len:152 (+) Transcript_13790:13-468(+)
MPSPPSPASTNPPSNPNSPPSPHAATTAAGDDHSDLRPVFRWMRESITNAYGTVTVGSALVTEKVDGISDRIGKEHRGIWSKYWAWRDTTEPTYALGTVCLATALASRPWGSLAIFRNSFLATGFTSWMMYPRLTGETLLEVKAFVKNQFK